MKNFLIDAGIILLTAAAVGVTDGLVADQHTSVITQLMITFLGAYTLGYMASHRRKEK
ncbi:hypothetical protein CPT_Moonbeam166 [Bacillus phage Moonbeam]|uniref:Uncharacterized protein n=1 Tax=Bacillus phage Moonbeam TaxID=1540091 RepID=A0A0A0RPM3_9CAUD|nr:hypothetical protein CPT_Moonbeam166 [Bacillus phage Moonbeam]AIW03564.1 hypothetical protein CPT_Moonbeam166 [Bacillus phage Moonbeam]